MISKAKLNYLKIAPRKVRLVADLIRKKKLEEAQNILYFTRKRAALPFKKTLDQAFANAKDNYPTIKKDDLVISEVFVDEGPVAKRRLPRARGKADIIKKRTSHITIILDEINKDGKDTIKKKVKPKKKKVKKEIKKESKKESKVGDKEKEAQKDKEKRMRRTKEEYSKKNKGLRAKKKGQVFHKKAF